MLFKFYNVIYIYDKYFPQIKIECFTYRYVR